MRFAPYSTYYGRFDVATDQPTNPVIGTRRSMHNSSRTVPAQRRVRAAPFAVGAVVAVLGLTTGCSSSTTPSTTSTSTSAAASAAATSGSASDAAGKEQVCAARDELKTSVAALTNASLLTGGTSGIQAAVEQVQTDLTAVKTAGKQTYATEVDAMQAAVDGLKTAAGDLGSGNAIDNLPSVGTAIAATGVAANDLFTKLAAAC